MRLALHVRSHPSQLAYPLYSTAFYSFKRESLLLPSSCPPFQTSNMPAFSRAVFLALQAAALVSLVGHPLSLAPSFALAAPVPLPMPLMPHLADYAAQPPARSSAASVPSSESVSTVRRQDVAVVSHTTSTSSPAVAHEARGDTDTNILNNINLLGTMYSQMNDHSRVLSKYTQSLDINLVDHAS